MYVAYTEGQNVRQAMAEVLGLESTASIASCMQCLTLLMSTQNAKLEQDNFMDNVMNPDRQAAAAEGVAPVHQVENGDMQKLSTTEEALTETSDIYS